MCFIYCPYIYIRNNIYIRKLSLYIYKESTKEDLILQYIVIWTIPKAVFLTHFWDQWFCQWVGIWKPWFRGNCNFKELARLLLPSVALSLLCQWCNLMFQLVLEPNTLQKRMGYMNSPFDRTAPITQTLGGSLGIQSLSKAQEPHCPSQKVCGSM